jgi:hypothetical protein
MAQIIVGSLTVEIDGKTVATLTHTGRSVTVHDPSGEKVLGRLFRSDNPPARVYTYNAFTAVHPGAPTPTDKMLGHDLVIEEAIDLILHQVKAVD